MRRIILLTFLILVPLAFADDTELFSVAVAPHALVVLDYSGSMCWTPDTDSTADIYPCNTYGLPDCPVEWSKYGIALAVMFDLLDADDDNDIDPDDENELGIPMGFLRYSGYGGTGGSLYNDKYYVIKDIGAPYTEIWDAVHTPVAWGGTPMNYALNRANKPAWYYESARWYLVNEAFPNDPARHCRFYAVVLITDGEDTYDCGGTGGSGSSSRRRASVHATWRLHQLCPDSTQLDSVLVYVIGLGADLSGYLKSTLNWMALYGGTDNPLEPNTGDPNDYTTPQDSCSGATDPGNEYLRGYAFIAEDAEGLAEALETIFESVSSMRFNFSSVGTPSIISERFEGDSSAFIGAFLPTQTGRWNGHFYKVKLNESLQITDTLWDAGQWLEAQSPDVRNIYTVKGGTWQPIDTNNVNLVPADFGVATDAEKNDIITYVRGMAPFEWKLGDIFHSSPLVVGAPVPFFYDVGYRGFINMWKTRPKRIYVGANDGLLHVFDGDNDVQGIEVSAFAPYDLLPKLQQPALYDEHAYFVDGSPVAYGTWDDDDGNGAKDSTEWNTTMICGYRRGGNKYFTLDITDPSNIPPPTTISDPFLTETWSVPVLDRVSHWSSNHFAERWFACFGGGYDTTASDTLGRAFYIYDVGGDNDGSNSLGMIRFDLINTPELEYCIPSSPAVADIVDSSRPGDIFPDGYADRIFVGDHGGNMWLIDIQSADTSDWRMTKLFYPDLLTSDTLHCFFAPTLALQFVKTTVGDTIVVMEKVPWLFWGTGDRANPTDSTEINRFYALRYLDTVNVATEAGLDDITGGGPPDSSARGWYIMLDEGEKVVSTPIVFSDNVFFTTFKPDTTVSSDPCQPAVGTSYIYGMSAWTGQGFFPGLERRKEISTPGLPPQPKIIIGDKVVKILLPAEELEVPGPKVKIRYPGWESTK